MRVWVDGGWGVDALAGKQTRSHEDLDLVMDVAVVTRLVDEADEAHELEMFWEAVRPAIAA